MGNSMEDGGQVIGLDSKGSGDVYCEATSWSNDLARFNNAV